MLDLYSMSANTDPGEILRIEQVLATTGLRRTMLYQHIREGTFPCQVALGARGVGWRKDEVDEWKRNRPVKQPKRKGVRDDTQKERDLTFGTLGPVPSTASRGKRRKAADSSANALYADVSKKANVILLHGDSDVEQGVKRTFVVVKKKSSPAVATEMEQVEHLRAENARLKELLVDLVLRNDELRSRVRNNSIRS
jgi:prophage regulatory protein